MKRLAIFIGGLLVMPAFAEVAPVFIDENDAIEYADGMYDENGFFVAPEEIVETETEADTQKMQTPVKISRAPVNATPVANRTTTTRAMPASAGATTASGRGSANGNSSRVVAARTTTASPRATASRTVASRGTTATSPRTGATTTSTRTATSTAATRAAAARTTGGATRAVTPSAGASVARTATTSPRTTAARTATATTARAATASGRLSVDPNRNVGTALKNATITAANGTVTLNDSGGTLYNKSASIRRTPTIRMSSLNGISAETTAVSTMSLEDMDDLAELTDYCKAQYANCMDNYCNVLDDNQGRCSCSANLKNYARAEAALKTATEELQDVAQKIQYIGLTTREVETLFTETIAEETMRTKGTDTSQLQASLNKIKDMIIDVKSGTATSSASNDILGLNFDLSGLLEFSFDSTGFDLGSLFGTTNTNSVSNQRGEELYKTAAARCKSSVLKACTARGVDASLVTNAYDLEIDRECMAYERSLNDSNDQMLATVRNAKNVLQKARLMVAQQKNAYDMRGCINALDACMQDEFVCGSDYENCLDPTGRYIVNGEIVIGSQPGHAIDPEFSNNVASVMTSDVCRVNLYRTWDMVPGTCNAHVATEDGQTAPNYTSYPSAEQGNAWGSGRNDTLSEYIKKTVTSSYPDRTSENMSLYLQNKIGYNQKDRNYGMCMSVLNKCQDYTYTRGTGTSAQYEPANQVVQQYLARVLVQIKAKQDEILANYAETCVSDVTSCLGQNGYPTEDPSDWEKTEYSTNRTKMNIAVNACRAQIVTCMSVNGYSIDTPTPTEMNCWVQGLLYSTSTGECMRNNLKQDCDDGEYLCQYTGVCLKEGETCEPQEYTVFIDCNGGVPTNIQSKITTNKVLRLDKTWCTLSSHNLYEWRCDGISYDPDSAYFPNQDSLVCKAQWDNNIPPAPTEYTVRINCGKQPNSFNTNNGELINEDGCESGACGQVVTSSGCIMLDVTPNGGTYCNWSNYKTGPNWNCSGGVLYRNGQFCPDSNDAFCRVVNRDGTNQDEPLWTEISFDYGNVTNSDLVSANPSRLYVDSNHVCDGVYDTLDTGSSTCPGDSHKYTYLTSVPYTYSNSMIFDGFYYNNNYNTTYIDKTGAFKSALYDIANLSSFAGDAFTLTAKWQPASPAAGGMRYVKIEDNGGARAQQWRKGGMLPSDTQYVWIDTDGSTCQYPGVYIADPNTNMVVCTSPVYTIGWWVKPGSRSSGFYIDVNGEKVLFAREWGEIVTENIDKFAATDPDTTLVATPTVYDTNVGYVSFDETNKTWTDTYSTSQVDQYAYLHNMFNIDFYPNRPGRSASQEEYNYTYIEGDGYYKQPTGVKVLAAPTITESGYTFRGFYPGPLSAVSSDDSIGMVWPATTGGKSPVTLSNKKWVLVTDDLNFQTLNLYAAWAKNCTNTNYCTLKIDDNGGVTYTITCPNGYTQIGDGADANCVDPNAGDWHSIEFPGATAD